MRIINAVLERFGYVKNSPTLINLNSADIEVINLALKEHLDNLIYEAEAFDLSQVTHANAPSLKLFFHGLETQKKIQKFKGA